MISQDGPLRSRVAKLPDGKWQVIFRGEPVREPFDTEDAGWHFLWVCQKSAFGMKRQAPRPSLLDYL